MNTKLLRQISEAFQRKPAKLAMRYLHSDRNGEATVFSCGTAHCIAGWAAVILDDGDICNGSFGRAIGCNFEAEQRLIFEEHWPEPFLTRYRNAKQPRTRARIAAARIEHFINTKGKE